VHPHYRAVTQPPRWPGLKLEELAYVRSSGQTASEALASCEGRDVTALVIQQPNFFGALEDVDALDRLGARAWCAGDRRRQSDVAGRAQASGQLGQRGADIVVGDGQPLGCPLASGGPYFGFMATRMEYVRQMPGRIVGRTVDLDGRRVSP